MPAPAFCRQRGHARHHHRRGAEIIPPAARSCGGAGAVGSPQAALDLFNRLQQHDPAAIQAYEYMSGLGVDLVLQHIPGAALPFRDPAPAYVLVELATPREGGDLRGSLETVLGAAIEAGVIADAVIAESGAQRTALWRLREEHSEAQKRAGASVKNDVSVPVSKVPELIRRATEICERLVPGIRCVPFGHLGDGNIMSTWSSPKAPTRRNFWRATTS